MCCFETGGPNLVIRALRTVQVVRSTWVERASPTYKLASGIAVLAVGNLINQLSGDA